MPMHRSWSSTTTPSKASLAALWFGFTQRTKDWAVSSSNPVSFASDSAKEPAT